VSGMTPRERFLAGIQGQPVDRTPVGSPTSVATVEQMDLLGASFPEVHRDGAAMATLAAGAYELLGYDAIMPVFSVIQEAAALGCEMEWGTRGSMPAVRTHPWPEPDDVCIPEDFLDRPPIRAALEAIRILRGRYGDEVAIIGKVMGPWTLSYHLHGLEDFLAETLLAPEKVHGFLRRLAQVPLLFGRAQLAAGADLLCLADHATGDLVRGAMYRDFLQPIHRELIAALDCPIVLHICGDTLDRIGYIAEAGFAAFHFDSKVDARAAMQAAGSRLSLVGNVNNAATLLHGAPEAVAAEARYAVEAGVRVIGPECAVPLQTPLSNLRAITAAVREDGPRP
jgi:MtaA/CmuA family methyltransferase